MTEADKEEADKEVPSVIFIVPYRDRAQQRAFFQRHMTGTVLAGKRPGSHVIWFVHQADARPLFNRGGIKNVGARIVQDEYPDHWRDITLVFNDVDTLPFTAELLPDFATQRGRVKHFFGFTFALGGIVSITGHDFDRVNGFPSFWAWGYEDNCLQLRCDATRGVSVDRSVFFPIFDKNVMQFPDGSSRLLHRSSFDAFRSNAATDGLYDVRDIRYSELLPDAADADADLLPGVRQFDVQHFATLAPEPAPETLEVMHLGQTHPFAAPPQPTQHALHTRFSTMFRGV